MGLFRSGMFLGTFITYLIAPMLIALYGWPILFYAFGVLTFVWALFFFFLTASTPRRHASILQCELDYIEASCAPKEAASIPWLKLLKSMPIWAIAVAHFCHDWGWSVRVHWMAVRLIFSVPDPCAAVAAAVAVC